MSKRTAFFGFSVFRFFGCLSFAFIVLCTSAYAADTMIKGTTANSTTASLEVTNSANTSLLTVRNDGNVGIGTTTPGTNFDVVGSIFFGNAAQHGVLSYNTGYVGIGNNSANTKTIITAGGINVLTVDGAGKVGIGTIAPNYNLDVASSVTTIRAKSTADVGNYALFQASNIGGDFYFGINDSVGKYLLNSGYAPYDRVINTNSSYPLKLAVNNAVALTIINGGNVGIGTTAPSSSLDIRAVVPVVNVKPTTGTNYAAQIFSNTSGTLYLGVESSTGSSLLGSGSAYDGAIGTGGATGFRLVTSNATRMYIQPGGNVGIGTVNPAANLHVKNSAIIEGSYLKIPVVSADPASPQDGMLWYNSAEGSFKCRQGGQTKKFAMQ